VNNLGDELVREIKDATDQIDMNIKLLVGDIAASELLVVSTKERALDDAKKLQVSLRATSTRCCLIA